MPKAWRKSKIIALLEPGKDPELPSSYHPISLLCHMFKLYGRLILNRIQDTLDSKLIPQQAGFRPGKSCTGQVLNLMELIEQGFEEKMITVVALVDLTAAYDIINHKILLAKTYNTMRDYNLIKIVESLLCTRRYYVMLDGKKSRKCGEAAETAKHVIFDCPALCRRRSSYLEVVQEEGRQLLDKLVSFDAETAPFSEEEVLF
nr:unnamed protein product [Callosobruchus chinensis]